MKKHPEKYAHIEQNKEPINEKDYNINNKQKRTQRPLVTSMIHNQPLSVYKNGGIYRFTYQKYSCIIDRDCVMKGVESELVKVADFAKNISEDMTTGCKIFAWCSGVIIGGKG